LEVDEDGARGVFLGASLAEQSIEGIVINADGFFGGRLSVGSRHCSPRHEFPS
jgi:hypothetical protein